MNTAFEYIFINDCVSYIYWTTNYYSRVQTISDSNDNIALLYGK
jgi:hypothetical protein